MKKLLILAGVLAAAVVLLVVAGAWMEPRHQVSRTRVFAATPERVWTAILSIRQLPIDRSDLKLLESPLEKDRLPPSIEVLGTPVLIEASRLVAPRNLVIITRGPDLAYPGTWTFTLVPENDATRLTVTEDASIQSPPLRFLVGRILGEDILIDGIFKAVARKLAETPRTTGGD